MFGVITGIVSSLLGGVVSKVASWGFSGFWKLATSRLGIAGIGVLSAFITYQAGQLHGVARATAKCNAAAAEARAAAARRDLEIQKTATQVAEEELDKTTAIINGLEKKVRKYETALAKRTAQCRATADDVRRLHSLGR